MAGQEGIWADTALQKNQEKSERMQIKPGEGSWLLPDALLSSRCPKLGVPPAQPLQCVPPRAQLPAHPPAKNRALVQNLNNLPQSCQQSLENKIQTSDSFINHWGETPARSSPGVRPALTCTGVGGRICSWRGSTFIPILWSPLTSQCTELSTALSPPLLWVRDTPKNPH